MGVLNFFSMIKKYFFDSFPFVFTLILKNSDIFFLIKNYFALKLKKK